MVHVMMKSKVSDVGVFSDKSTATSTNLLELSLSVLSYKVFLRKLSDFDTVFLLCCLSSSEEVTFGRSESYSTSP